MKVWKYPLIIQDKFMIRMPSCSYILRFDVQTGTPVIWVAVDDMEPLVERNFILVGTGRNFDAHGLAYIGTIQMDEGTLIWHLFENLNPSPI